MPGKFALAWAMKEATLASMLRKDAMLVCLNSVMDRNVSNMWLTSVPSNTVVRIDLFTPWKSVHGPYLNPKPPTLNPKPYEA
jgi:hypothetical protein